MSELKNQTKIGTEFSNMLSSAKVYFNTSDHKKYEYHQCLVLGTNQGKEKVYSFTCDSVTDLINQSCSILLQERIPTVQKIVCMWEGGAIDVPSYKFMKTLCDTNPENKKAEILLSAGTDAYVTKKISDIIG